VGPLLRGRLLRVRGATIVVAMTVATIEPFRIDVSDAVLDDLRHRLLRTRFAPDFANDDWTYGFPTAYLRELVEHWLERYDWRTVERQLNELPNFRAPLGDVSVHFVHVRGRGPSPVPLILTHGWPWTYWDMHRLVGPLTDPARHGLDDDISFDVVIPSLPGFGFSTPMRTKGMNFWRTADLWVDLMAAIGHDRFGAYGCDWGALVTGQLAHKHADRLIAAHGAAPPWLFNVERPWAEVVRTELPDDPAGRAAALRWERDRSSHVAVHTIEPQTLAAALHDSPAGLAAWLLERRRTWSDCDGVIERHWSKDDLLTTVMLYWVTESAVTSMRFYREAVLEPWRPAHDRSPVLEAPVGISVYHPDRPPAPMASMRPAAMAGMDVVSYHEHDRGGHFPPAESPDTVVHDLRATFAAVRERGVSTTTGRRPPTAAPP
jgi:pimeloyl-ACP methyl ester carboxylesterase